MVATKIEEIKISAMAAAVSNTWTALTDMEEDFKRKENQPQ